MSEVSSPSQLAHPRDFYQAFGLKIGSVLPLPELLRGQEKAAVDIEIAYGSVPEELPGALKKGVRYQAGKAELLLQVDGVARFLVSEGLRVTIDRDPEAEDDDVRVFLLGSVFGALLHQRGDLVLHGSAVEWEGKAVVFLGNSGVGKSTLSSAFRQRGHALLTDDLCVVRPDSEGVMLAYPGFPQTKLWLDSLQKLDLSPDGLKRIRNKLEKRAVPVVSEFTRSPLPVRQLYLLRPHNKLELKLSPASGPGKFNLLKNQTYRFKFLAGIDGKATHFQHALKLAQQAPLSVASRPSGTFQLDELVELIRDDLKAK